MIDRDAIRAEWSERGTVLVLFALMAFAIMGIAALSIDLGYAILTRVQMQNAVEGAAVEGVRALESRDLDGATRQREHVRDFVKIWFNDEFQVPGPALGPGATDTFPRGRPQGGSPGSIDPTEMGDPLFGAGPIIGLSGGIGDANASQKIEESQLGVYKPDLRLNLANQAHGDMVSGEYIEPDTRGNLVHREDSSYARVDFEVAGEPWEGHAFLVRMRRTPNFDGLDQVPGVSSRGPTLPFLFGRGTVMAGRQSGERYSPRHDGITVRGTAMAEAHRALTVGVADPTNGIVGVTPFALSRPLWERLLAGEAEAPESRTFPQGGSAEAPGSLVGWDDPGVRCVDETKPHSVGESVGPCPADPPPGPPRPGYVPVFFEGTERIIGFGLVEWESRGDSIVMRAVADPGAGDNASTVLREGVLGRDSLSREPGGELEAHLEMQGSLMAPVIVR